MLTVFAEEDALAAKLVFKSGKLLQQIGALH
jgi:hypothetical protein